MSQSFAERVREQTLGVRESPTLARLAAWNAVTQAANALSYGECDAAEREELIATLDRELDSLSHLERYWARPGRAAVLALRQLLAEHDVSRLAHEVAGAVEQADDASFTDSGDRGAGVGGDDSTESIGFTVLVVGDYSDDDAARLAEQIRDLRGGHEQFVYDVLVVPSFEDALIAVLFNHDVQAVVTQYAFRLRSDEQLPFVHEYMATLERDGEVGTALERGPALGALIGEIRPELDLYLYTDVPLAELDEGMHGVFRRVFYRGDNDLELHMAILDGVRARFATPFFDALKRFAQQPTGVFHALPISRGNSVFTSKWIREMSDFYGPSIFMAETSATTGGLDSLLQPTGAIKDAQQAAARTFGSDRTFWVTNGTSTANKIVVQTLVAPGDIVLIDRNCHKSHHYGMVLGGGLPVYLDAYRLEEYSMYGGVPLEEIKRTLLTLRKEGRLDRVKMLLLTNCTFDGVVYNVERVMEEVLAIKPDICFLWDEAWFAYARFHPVWRQRTAMQAAQAVRRRLDGDEHRARYERHRATVADLDPDDVEAWVEQPLVADPDTARLRVYSTQSTHKSLSCLRQGSMIHVRDEDFARLAEEPFMEAYMAHTSTSPNYQILASLDMARRQVDFEGYGLVDDTIASALTIREVVANHPRLREYFSVLNPEDLVPAGHRESGTARYDREDHPGALDADIVEAFANDEFVLDPTRVTLYIAKTGMDGYEFRNEALMAEHGIQVNKTAINSVLFLTNIGVGRSAVAYLVDVLLQLADEMDRHLKDMSPAERELHEQAVERLTSDLPPLPNFSHFHEAFRPNPATKEGDMRSAYFLGYDSTNREHLRLGGEVEAAMAAGRELVATTFIIPYPPGFPVLVPGQVVSEDIVEFMNKLDITEVHGYRADLGLSVFTEDALAAQAGGRARPKRRRRNGSERTERPALAGATA